MSDCRFGVSPVNYPDPVPLVKSAIKDVKMTEIHQKVAILPKFAPYNMSVQG